MRPLWQWRQHQGINHEGALWHWIHLPKVLIGGELKVDVQPSGVIYVRLTYNDEKQDFSPEVGTAKCGVLLFRRECCNLTARRHGRATVSVDGSKWINKWSMNELQTLSHVCTNTSIYDRTDRCSIAAHPQTVSGRELLRQTKTSQHFLLSVVLGQKGCPIGPAGSLGVKRPSCDIGSPILVPWDLLFWLYFMVAHKNFTIPIMTLNQDFCIGQNRGY